MTIPRNWFRDCIDPSPPHRSTAYCDHSRAVTVTPCLWRNLDPSAQCEHGRTHPKTSDCLPLVSPPASATVPRDTKEPMFCRRGSWTVLTEVPGYFRLLTAPQSRQNQSYFVRSLSFPLVSSYLRSDKVQAGQEGNCILCSQSTFLRPTVSIDRRDF